MSRELSRELIKRLNQVSEGIELIERDFSKEPIPHLDGARLGALFTPAEARSEEQNQAVAFADQLIDELMQADTLVIALGGKHEAGGSDFMRPYMKLILNFVGITDIEFISAEGLSMGDEPRVAGLAAAREAISQIAA